MFERSNYTEEQGKFGELQAPGGIWSRFIELFRGRGANLISPKNREGAVECVLEMLMQGEFRPTAIQSRLVERFGRIQVHSFYDLMHDLERAGKVELVYRNERIKEHERSTAYYRGSGLQ